MVKICPISSKQINENISRLNAITTVLFTVAYIITFSKVFLVVIFADYLLRNIYEGKYSPVLIMNRYIADAVLMKVQLINAGPKIFAARIGLMLSAASLVFGIFSLDSAALVFLLLLGSFSFLEGVFGFCVACKIYPVLRGWSL